VGVRVLAIETHVIVIFAAVPLPLPAVRLCEEWIKGTYTD